MKHKKIIALALISSLILSGFGQMPGSFVKAYTTESSENRADVNSVEEPVITPVPTPSSPSPSWSSTPETTPSEVVPRETPTLSCVTRVPSPGESYAPSETPTLSCVTHVPSSEPNDSPYPTLVRPTKVPSEWTNVTYTSPSGYPYTTVNLKAVYNRSEKQVLRITGSDLKWVSSLMVDGLKLYRNYEYSVQDRYITIYDSIADLLSVGKHRVTVYYSYSEISKSSVAQVDLYVIIYKYENTYVPDYPQNESSNLRTSQFIAESVSDMDIPYEQDADFSEVLIDHKVYGKTHVTGEKYFFVGTNFQDVVLPAITTKDLTKGVHYIEIVSNGKSEVVQLILVEDIEKFLGDKLISLEPPKPTVVTPEPEPEPSPLYPPTPSIPLYDTFFHMTSSAIYNTAVDSTVIFYGDLYGLNSIYYDGRKLEHGKDYNRGGDYLEFTDEFLAALPYGNNELTIYANYNPSAQNAPSSGYIDKVNIPFPQTYETKCPLSETRNFTIGMNICSSNSVSCMYAMKEAKIYDEIYFDHQLITQENVCNSFDTDINHLFTISRSFFKDLDIGLHYIELVSEGKSEVIYLIITEMGTDDMEALLDICKPVAESMLKVEVSTEAKNYISQRYTIKQTDSESPLLLDKLKIRYYYEKDGDKPETFTCDNAGISLSMAPYYKSCTNMVYGSFEDGYVEISFDDSYNLKKDSLQLSVRLNQTDWSSYTGLQEGYVEAYYEGNMVYSSK